jgi:6-pyruvoyltetrahydropterin/6-carboxytetrahydropterin synthase
MIIPLFSSTAEIWIIHKTFSFEASHILPHYDGKCSRLHGHSWRGTVYLKAEKLKTEGPHRSMVADFESLATNFINPLVEEYLDHYHLNDTLKIPNPSCEEVAKWMYQMLRKGGIGEMLHAIEIGETCTSGAVYVGQ